MFWKGKSIHIWTSLSYWLECKCDGWSSSSYLGSWNGNYMLRGVTGQKEPLVTDIMQSHISPRMPSSGLFLEEKNKFLLCLNCYHFCGLCYYHLWVYLILTDPPFSKFSFATSPVWLRMLPKFIFLSFPHPDQIVSFLSSFKIQLQIQTWDPTWKWLILLSLRNLVNSSLNNTYLYMYMYIQWWINKIFKYCNIFLTSSTTFTPKHSLFT